MKEITAKDCEKIVNLVLETDNKTSSVVVNDYLTLFFTERQKEIILKKVYGIGLSKSEREYYSKTIKKRLSAIADPLFHRLSYNIVTHKS